MVLAGRYPNDTRVERENRLLQSLGHEIYLLCERREEWEPSSERVDGVTVERIVRCSGFWGIAISAIFKTMAVDVAWYLRIRRFVESHRLQVLHVHDQPLVLTAYLVSGRYRIPLIFDVHDRVPIAMESWQLETSWNERILMSSRRMRRLEQKSLHKANAVVCASNTYRKDYLTDGIPENKIVVFENVVDFEWFRSRPLNDATIAEYASSFVILYIGSFGARRGLDLAIRAMPPILKHVPEAKLMLVGPPAAVQQAERPTISFLREMVVELGLSKAVIFAGALDSSLIPTYVAVSKVGMILFNRTRHYESVVTNKLFEYMAGGKPVVVTDVGAMKRVVEEVGCGLVVPSGDSEALAAAIVRLHDNPAMAEEMGRKGREAVEERYNVRAMSQDFLAMYERIEHLVEQTRRT